MRDSTLQVVITGLMISGKKYIRLKFVRLPVSEVLIQCMWYCPGYDCYARVGHFTSPSLSRDYTTDTDR